MSINTVKPFNKSKNNGERWVESGALREVQQGDGEINLRVGQCLDALSMWHGGHLLTTFKNMAKYAKQQIRSNRIKRVTEGSYADLYHKEEEYERKKRQRIRELNRGAPQYNCRIKW